MNEEELEKIIEDKAHSKFIEAKADVVVSEPILSDEQKFKIEKEAQAKAVFDKASSDPKALVKAQISQGAIDLVNTNPNFKERITKVSKNTVNSAINDVEGDNRKSDNASYYSGREEAINSMGGGADTSQDKQKYMNAIYNVWWYIVMTILGIFFIAPLKVLLNWGLALSPEQIKRTTSNGTESIEKTKRIHWVAGLFSIVFYIAYLIGLACLIILIVRLFA